MIAQVPITKQHSSVATMHNFHLSGRLWINQNSASVLKIAHATIAKPGIPFAEQEDPLGVDGSWKRVGNIPWLYWGYP